MAPDSALSPNGKRRVVARVILFCGVSLPILLTVALCTVYCVSQRRQARIDDALARSYTARQLGHVSATIALLRTRLEAGSIYTEASSTAASSRFSQLLQSGLRGAGAEIRTVDLQPSQTRPGLERLEVAFDLTLPQDRLPGLIAALGRLRPVVFMDAVNISGALLGQPEGVLLIKLKLSSFRELPNAGD
jgi:hypothetical protein